jgi:A/G-specific adenine glycosylase
MRSTPMPAIAAPVPLLRAALLDWYDRARRTLPWRASPGAAVDPWAVLVSELMLQQTTVATVRARFATFLDRFPTLASLAASPLDDVLHAWQGLGYYRRARALHACAQTVVERHGGRLPLEFDALLDLPGIGPYTAAAVAAIASERAVVPVDANVERVLGRMTALAIPLPAARPRLRGVAAGLAGPDRAGDFAQALMELGALVCTPRRPACLACPWRSWCSAAAAGEPERYPGQPAKKERPARFAVAFLLARGDGAVLFRRRPETGLLAGMVELPSTPWLAEAAAAEVAVPDSLPMVVPLSPLAGTVRHLFTHLDLTMRVAHGRIDATRPGLWVPPDQFADLALPTLTKKLLRHAGFAR